MIDALSSEVERGTTGITFLSEGSAVFLAGFLEKIYFLAKIISSLRAGEAFSWRQNLGMR